jgi:hypothetical protein
VIGAIGAVTGAFMHGFGVGAGSWASSAAEVAAAGGKSGLTGTMMHAAAHGVSGGAMAAANGGSFKDGFIGGAIGFGVGLPFGGTGGMIKGGGLGAIAARTAIAAVGGGVGSKLAGGSFADGAYSAAFFHLFNSELENLQEGLRRSWEGAKAALSYFGREFPNAAAELPGQLSDGFSAAMENDAIAATLVISNAPMALAGTEAVLFGTFSRAPIFWSGFRQNALTGAQSLTASGVGVHMEGTFGGRILSAIDGASRAMFNRAVVPDAAWSWASRSFATYATGPVAHAVIRAPGKVWTTVEKPILKARDFVIKYWD